MELKVIGFISFFLFQFTAWTEKFKKPKPLLYVDPELKFIDYVTEGKEWKQINLFTKFC